MSRVYIAWRGLRKSKLGLVATGCSIAIIVMGIFAPIIAPYNPNKIFHGKVSLPPNESFLFGTDYIGRDVLSQVIWGTRTSLFIAFGAVMVELFIGIFVGLVSGYFGGVTDQILMRIIDAILTLPTIVLLIVAVAFFRAQSEISILLVMGLVNWPWLAKIIRGQVLSLRETEFIEAARSMGAGNFYIITRHILPNTLSPIIVTLTFDVAWFILYEATISFLGLGNPTVPSWGRLLYIGRGYLSAAPWITLFSGLAIMFTVLSLNMLGDSLSDALAVRK